MSGPCWPAYRASPDANYLKRLLKARPKALETIRSSPNAYKQIFEAGKKNFPCPLPYCNSCVFSGDFCRNYRQERTMVIELAFEAQEALFPEDAK